MTTALIILSVLLLIASIGWYRSSIYGACYKTLADDRAEFVRAGEIREAELKRQCTKAENDARQWRGLCKAFSESVNERDEMTGKP